MVQEISLASWACTLPAFRELESSINLADTVSHLRLSSRDLEQNKPKSLFNAASSVEEPSSFVKI